jgi:hypothetical protein
MAGGNSLQSAVETVDILTETDPRTSRVNVRCVKTETDLFAQQRQHFTAFYMVHEEVINHRSFTLKKTIF